MNYSKLAKYETMAHREGMLQHIKEKDFWNYTESRGYYTYSPWGYFHTFLEKSIGKNAQEIFNKIKSDGYEKVLAVTISSGLSGTYNAIRIIAEQQKDLDLLF